MTSRRTSSSSSSAEPACSLVSLACLCPSCHLSELVSWYQAAKQQMNRQTERAADPRRTILHLIPDKQQKINCFSVLPTPPWWNIVVLPTLAALMILHCCRWWRHDNEFIRDRGALKLLAAVGGIGLNCFSAAALALLNGQSLCRGHLR